MRRRRRANAPRRPAGWINVLLILLSLSPLALGEAYLRSIGYGYDHRLLRPAEGSDRVELNVEAYRRYFPANELVSKSRIPKLFKRDVSFGKRKAANVFRVFCFGGSTTAGDFAHRNFPELLGEMLSRVVRGRDIEVINLGITTINSYQVAEFVAEAVEFDPDLFVVYTGHNEIYGPLGVASSAPGSASYWLTSAFLLLQQFKVFQLLQQLFIDLMDRTSDEDKTDSLFRTMVESPLAPASPLRATSRRIFERNIDRIIARSEKGGVPLILTTVVSNLRDFRPFDSAVPPELEIATQWQSLLAVAASKRLRGQYRESERLLLRAIDVYPDNAQQHFELGQLYLSKNEAQAALLALTKARDLDVIPFRAPSAINAVLRAKAGERGVTLLDLERTLQGHARDGVIGKPLIVEHLHPSAYGHYLIAAALCDLILDLGLLHAAERLDYADPLVRASFDVRINSETFDGRRMWPFTINNADYRFP